MSKASLLVTTIKLYTFILVLRESVCRLGGNLPNIINLDNLFYSNRYPRELVVLTILMFIQKFLPFIVFTICVYF